MNARSKIVFGLTAGLCLGFASGAAAGPCSEQISDLGRKLSQSPAMGPAVTGALSGSNPGNVRPSAQPGDVPLTGTSADNRGGGTLGTKEMNAVANSRIATSPADVRAQQEGKPTAAAIAGGGAAGTSVETMPAQAAAQQAGNMPDDRMSQAKMELEKARMLDQKDDRACAGAVDRTRQLMGG